MTSQTPYEQIKFINDVIKDREDKKQPTFFSVKVERYGELTPMVNKEPGGNFYETILQYLTKYELSALIIELYSGKSHNVREPFQQFRLIIKKAPVITMGSTDNSIDIPVTHSETVISPEKHFFGMAEKERQVMMLEFDIKRLSYENEELRRKLKKKKKLIAELETEIGKTEKEKKDSLGNVTLGYIGANALEQFVKSDVGSGLLGIFKGKAGELGNTQTPPPQSNQSEQKSTATVMTDKEKPLSENEKIRKQLINYITSFLEKSNDTVLRAYYELLIELGSDTQLLLSITDQVKNYLSKQSSSMEKEMKSNINTHNNSPIQETENEDEQENFNDSS